MNKYALEFGDGLGFKVAYSNAITIDITDSIKIAWVSGQIAFDEENKIIGVGDITIQTEQCIKNIESTLKAVGGTLDDVVKVVIYVKEMENLKDIHRIRLKYFNEPYPTSTLIKVVDFVNSDALIEIEAEAVIELKK